MFFWNRKKREESFEEKLGELDTTVLLEKDYKNARKIEQHVVERLEQTIEVAKEMEDEKAEYRMLTAYLNDIQLLEGLPEEDRDKITDVAINVVQLNAARTEFLNSSKKLTDAQFAQMEQEEKEIPAALRRLMANEAYRETLRKDMRYLEREKSEWIMRKDYLEHQQKSLKNLLYILIGTAATAAVLLGFFQLMTKQDFFYGWLALIFVTAVSVCGIYLKIQGDADEALTADRNRNRAIVIQNKVKLKYVNITNAVEYVCEKFHVHNSTELNEQWKYYLEAVKEREKYQRTNEDLEYFNAKLVRMLSAYCLYDAQVWVTQAAALINPKEMVEVKHGLVIRRQKLRGRIEYNLGAIKELKREAEMLLNRVGGMRPQVEQILEAIEKLMED